MIQHKWAITRDARGVHPSFSAWAIVYMHKLVEGVGSNYITLESPFRVRYPKDDLYVDRSPPSSLVICEFYYGSFEPPPLRVRGNPPVLNTNKNSSRFLDTLIGKTAHQVIGTLLVLLLLEKVKIDEVIQLQPNRNLNVAHG